jgi:competence protein ComGC
MKSSTQPRSCRADAFTRAELLVILAVLTLLALVVLPALANSRPRSARVICANNLRQIGMGFQLWGNDHGDQPPWELRPEQGGTQQHPLAVNAWLHYAWISNELNSARVLLCPSDSGRVAEDFSVSPNGGYLHQNYRNLATSYFLTHAFYGGQFSMFAGDRNLGWDSIGSCSRFPQVYNVDARRPTFGWDTNLHNQAGNIVRLDGRVNQYSNEELRAATSADPISDRDLISPLHILQPR